MPSAEHDLEYLQGCLTDLESYLLSDELYWTVDGSSLSGHPAYTRLTPGGLLLAKKRLMTRSLTLPQQMTFARLLPEIDAICAKWHVAWEKKASRDFRSRLGMWGNFLDEYRRRPEEHFDRYAYEVRLRVMLHLLTSEAALSSPAEHELLARLDQLLGAILVRGEFVWDVEMRAGFATEEYWYLYGSLPNRLHNRQVYHQKD